MQSPATPPSQPPPIRICEGIARKAGRSKLATILQLSDLHLLAKTPLRGDRHDSFLPDLKRALETQKEQFDLVVVTGDLIDASEWWPGRWKKAFAKALDAVLEICQAVGVDPEEGLLVIPGNHDLRWMGNYGLRTLERGFEAHFRRYFSHSYYPGLGLLVACFDSNEKVRPLFLDWAKGWASTTQCDAVLEGIKGLPEPHRQGAERAFRMALIHHHLMAIPADDRAADRKIVGAPSLMLLRNAGNFLRRLLRDGYRLVLHGHLHTDGYWLPQTFLSDDASPRWLELISCPWSGVNGGKNNVRAFNVVKIHDTGVVQSYRAEFQEGWTDLRPIAQAMAGYNLVRTRSWDLRERPADSLVCDTYSQRWDLILPAGDIIVTEVIRGLRGENGPIEQIEVFKEATGLTLIDFSAEYLGPRRGPIPYERSPDRRPDAEEPRIVFRLKLDPDLTRDGTGKVDILLRSKIFGGIASSREDQEYSRVGPRKKGREEIYHEVRRIACGRLVINVRFFSVGPEEPATERVPETMDLRVYDPDLQIAPYEQGSDHITWDFWSRDREARQGHYALPSVPEATLSVYRPQVHYGYALEWELPEHEPILEIESLRNQRIRLLRIQESPTAFAAVQGFLTALKEFVRVGLRTRDPNCDWNDQSLGVYLYAFDEGQGELIRRWQDSFYNDTFPETIAYGRDFIGTAFRSWYPCSYHRLAAAGQPLPLFDQISEERVTSLFACPLWRAEWRDQPADGSIVQDPIDIAPVGVLAVASGVEGSGLGYIASHEDAGKELHRQIVTLWRKCQLEAGWVAPR